MTAFNLSLILYSCIFGSHFTMYRCNPFVGMTWRWIFSVSLLLVTLPKLQEHSGSSAVSLSHRIDSKLDRRAIHLVVTLDLIPSGRWRKHYIHHAHDNKNLHELVMHHRMYNQVGRVGFMHSKLSFFLVGGCGCRSKYRPPWGFCSVIDSVSSHRSFSKTYQSSITW